MRVSLIPSRSFSRLPVLIVISPRVVSIFPDVFITWLLALPAASFCIHRLFPARISPRWLVMLLAYSAILLAAYSSAVLMMDPGALSVREPRVPVKPSTVILPRLAMVISPPPWIVPAPLSATVLPESVLAPVPVVICPLFVNCPPAVRLTACPCITLRLSIAPLLLIASVLPAASAVLLVNALVSFKVRLPSATTCPTPSRPLLSSHRSPPLNSLPAAL
ncbi:hypothetical protein D3C80_958360 [compost metagenome]